MFFGRNDAKAETPVLWPPHVKRWLIGKDSDAGRDWGQEEKGMTEDEMAGWHHRLDGCKFEWTPGVGDGQGGLACCDSWGRKESDMTKWLNWTELNLKKHSLICFFFPICNLFSWFRLCYFLLLCYLQSSVTSLHHFCLWKQCLEVSRLYWLCLSPHLHSPSSWNIHL